MRQPDRLRYCLDIAFQRWKRGLDVVVRSALDDGEGISDRSCGGSVKYERYELPGFVLILRAD